MTLEQKTLMAEFVRRALVVADDLKLPVACLTVAALVGGQGGDPVEKQFLTIAVVAGAFRGEENTKMLIEKTSGAIRIAQTAQAEPADGKSDPGKSN